MAAVCLIILIAAPPAFAEVELSLTVDRSSVSPDELLRLELSVSGKDAGSVSKPVIEGIENFEVIGRSSGSQLQITGLKLTSRKSYSYTLRPLTTGVTARLRAVVKVGNDEHASTIVEIELVKSSGKGTPRQPSQAPRGNLFGLDDPFFGGSGPGYREDDFLVQASVNSRTVYVGQEVVYKLSFYRAVNVWSAPKFAMPEVKGFWSVLPPGRDRRRSYTESVGGRRYTVTENALLLYPLSAGKAAIGPGGVRFQPEPFSSALQLRADGVEIEVLPLPEQGKPPDYTGLAGRFSINAWIKAVPSQVGKPVTITVSITGSGNVHGIPKPTTPDLRDFELYEPEIKDEFTISAGGSGGSRNFTYLLVPKRKGKLSVGPFLSNYFDPKTREYKTIATKEIVLDVEGTTGSIAPPAQGRRESLEELGGGIRQIKPDVTELKEEGRPYYERPAFYLYIVTLLLSLTAYSGYIKKRRRLALDTTRMRRQNARRTAEERLKKAGLLIDEKNHDRFFGEMSNGLRRFLADKCDIDEAGLTTEEIGEIAGSVNGDSGLDSRFSRLLQECDRARFAPAAHEKSEMKRLLKEAYSIIEELEKKL